MDVFSGPTDAGQWGEPGVKKIYTRGAREGEWDSGSAPCRSGGLAIPKGKRTQGSPARAALRGIVREEGGRKGRTPLEV